MRVVQRKSRNPTSSKPESRPQVFLQEKWSLALHSQDWKKEELTSETGMKWQKCQSSQVTQEDCSLFSFSCPFLVSGTTSGLQTRIISLECQPRMRSRKRQSRRRILRSMESRSRRCLCHSFHVPSDRIKRNKTGKGIESSLLLRP